MNGVPVPLRGLIERRLLISYRLDPAFVTDLLPGPLRPQLVGGAAVGGVCLIRLGAIRPSWFAPAIGWRGESAAHRIAVEWDEDGGVRTGVYIPERHSSSWLPVAVGGRLFPGVHHHARFEVRESPVRFAVTMTSRTVDVSADVALTDEWRSSLFPSPEDASEFFRLGSVGWSPSRDGRSLEGVRLDTRTWSVTPGRALRIESSVFDGLDPSIAALDNVLVMRDTPVRWSAPGSPAPQAAGDRAAARVS